MSEENKRVAMAFYEKALNDRDAETAFRLYAGKHYRQHNPLVEDGQEGVRKFAKWIGDNHPNAHGEIKRAFADGDFVILHCHWIGLISDSGDAVVDIFRLEDGRLWNIGTSSSRFQKPSRTTTRCSNTKHRVSPSTLFVPKPATAEEGKWPGLWQMGT